MQTIAKLKNKSTVWSAQLRPRVLDVVSYSGSNYQNTSGLNATPTDTNHWFALPTTVKIINVLKLANQVAGSDPDFYIDLSADGMPVFPVSLKAYIKIDNASPFTEVSPVAYDPATKILHGMNDPAALPDMQIRILAM